jgi:hypothetical protein
VVFVEDDPFRVHLAVQKFLQKVTVRLEQYSRSAGFATVLAELVTDSFSARLVVEFCGVLREGECCNASRLQYDNATIEVIAQEPWDVQRLTATGGRFDEQVVRLVDGVYELLFFFGNG